MASTTNNGTFYPTKSYLDALSMTLDGTFKLYPSKYIALKGTINPETIVSLCDGSTSGLTEQEDILKTQRLSPFCVNDGSLNIEEPHISDPNPNDTYVNQELGDLGTLMCGGDVNFLNHSSDANETIIYVSQSDIKNFTCITQFTEEWDLNKSIFVETTKAVDNPAASNFSFNSILIFFNLYRKVGESIDEDVDAYALDLPMGIYSISSEQTLSSSQEWVTRLYSSFSNGGTVSVSISDEGLKSLEDVTGNLNDAIETYNTLSNTDYTDLDEVREYYDTFKDNRHVNVPYIQGDWWFVNGKKAGLYQIGVDTSPWNSMIKSIEEEQNALEKWVGYDGSLGSYSSLYAWVSDISSNFLTVSKAEEMFMSSGDFDEMYDNLKKDIDNAIEQCTYTAGSNVTITDNVISVDLSAYSTSSDLQQQIADLIDAMVPESVESAVNEAMGNYQLHITSVSNPDGWPALSLTDHTSSASLSFAGGHYHQTYISAGAYYDYDDGNPYLDDNVYMQESYGTTPHTSEPLINTSTNAQTYNTITTQVMQENTNSGFSTYNEDSTYVKNTSYYKKPFAYTRIMTRDNSFKDFIPRAYMQVTPDIIEFLIDTHTEATSNDNHNPTWESVMGDQTKPSYSTHVWIDNAGFHIGEVKLSVINSKLYVNDVEVELKS